MKTYDLVVIGAGSAGIRAASTARETNAQASILLVHGEQDLPYDRTRLSKQPLDQIEASSLLLHDEDWYSRNNIELRTGCSAESLDRQEQTIRIVSKPGRADNNRDNDQGNDQADNQTITFKKLILATGSEPLLPRGIPEEQPHGLYVFRTREDAEKLESGIKGAKKVLIAGMGVLAVELSQMLIQRGIAVVLAGATPQLMARRTNARAGELLEEVLLSKGVTLHFQEEIMGLERKKKSKRWSVELIRNTVECDAVVFCIGVKPTTALAQDAGLTCRLGIQVNEYLQTEDPAIFAAGDCAEHPDGTHSFLWNDAAAQGEVAGHNAVAASHESFRRWDSPPIALQTEVFGQTVCSVRVPRDPLQHQVDEFELERRYYAFYLDDHHVVGAVAMNDPDAAAQLTEAVRLGWDLLQTRRALSLD